MADKIPLTLMPEFDAGFRERIDRMLGKHIKGWLARKWHSLYGMGQNLSFIFRHWKKKGHVSWLERPGDENCASGVASPFSCGFERIKWAVDYLFGLPTEKVAPGHYGIMPDKFRIIAPDEPLKKYYVIIHMSYAEEPPPKIESVFAKLALSFRSLASLLGEWHTNFANGIRSEQYWYLGIRSVFWQATHVRVITEAYGNTVKVFSQDLIASEKEIPIQEIREGMQGDKPKYKVGAPEFIDRA